MNKKMLLVVLMPFAVNATLADLLKGASDQVNGLQDLATAPFGEGQEKLNSVASAVVRDILQAHAKNTVSAIDAKFLGRTLLDQKRVKLTTGDLLTFTAAVGVSCAFDKGNGKSVAENAVSHSATRLSVAALKALYNSVAPQVASLLGVDVLDVEATINEALPKEIAAAANYVRTVMVDAAVYDVTRGAVSRLTTGFFAKS